LRQWIRNWGGKLHLASRLAGAAVQGRLQRLSWLALRTRAPGASRIAFGRLGKELECDARNV